MGHASEAQLREYAGDARVTRFGTENPDADLDVLLERASELVDSAVTVSYDITDDVMLTGLWKATSAQVEWWFASSDETGFMAQFEAVSFPGALSLSGKQARLAPRARDLLRSAGIMNISVGVL